MKRRLWLMLMGMIISVMMATASFAEYVYVTKNGKKYHHEQSRFLKNKEAEKITVEEAIARGLEPSKEYLRLKETLNDQGDVAKNPSSDKKTVTKK